jgi:Zn-dependent protease
MRPAWQEFWAARAWAASNFLVNSSVPESVTANPSTSVPPPVPLGAPEPIFNCPECSQWLPPGSLDCPACHAVVYGNHLRQIAIAATGEEKANHWLQARETWRQALPWLPAGGDQYKAVELRIGQIDTQLAGQAKKKADWTRRLGPFAPLLTLLVFLSKLKIVLSMFSFFAFFGIYWGLFGPWFGGGFTLSILLHEMGHWIAAKRRGLKVDLPVFLPGFGAYVRWYSQGVSLDDLSSIALAGPFSGLLASIAFGVISSTLEPGFWQNLFSALAHVSAWLNLINLIPVFGLDGAQATYALDRTQRWLVLATALIFFGWLHEFSFLFIAAGMGWRLIQGGYAERPSTRTLVRYVLLLFVLGLVIYRFPDPGGRF